MAKQNLATKASNNDPVSKDFNSVLKRMLSTRPSTKAKQKDKKKPAK